MRVWKGVYEIRDLTKIWCGNRENHKYLGGIRDSLLPGKGDWPKFEHGMRDFFCLSVSLLLNTIALTLLYNGMIILIIVVSKGCLKLVSSTA